MADSKRKRILFVGEAVTLAHVTRPLILAQALDPQQVEIHFACDEAYDFVLQETPFRRWRIKSIAPERFRRALTDGTPPYDLATLDEYVKEDLRLLEDVQPDLVVGDFRLSLAVSTAVSKVHYAAVADARWSPYRTQQSFPVPDLPMVHRLGLKGSQALFRLVRPQMFRAYARPFNALRRRYGQARLGSLLDVYTQGDSTLYVDIPSLYPTANAPDSHQYLGPIIWSPSVTLPSWWHTIDADKPIIYLTLGSSGQVDVLPQVFDALESLPVSVILATANRVPLDRLPRNVQAADYLPGDQAARRAALVICNGGSAATYQAFREGTPVLGIPANLDQHLNMSAICQAGVGTQIRSDQVTTASMLQAVTALLEDHRYSDAAQRLAEEMSQYDPTERFRSFVAQTLGHGAAVGPRDVALRSMREA